MLKVGTIIEETGVFKGMKWEVILSQGSLGYPIVRPLDPNKREGGFTDLHLTFAYNVVSVPT